MNKLIWIFCGMVSTGFWFVNTDKDIISPKGEDKKSKNFNWNALELQDSVTISTYPGVFIKQEANKSIPLAVRDLNITVQVLNNFAITTMEMTFFNELDRILEGELYFPLGQGQTVSRFAMDVNGKLREGVVVEKKKGRVAFESTVRRQIDPGLVEWTKGNNFKSRVYPIPANGKKTILIAYTQELQQSQGHAIYKLPMNFKDQLDHLKIDVQLDATNHKPLVKSNDYQFKFKETQNGYEAQTIKMNTNADQPIELAIPLVTDKPQVVTYEADGILYYYAKSSLESKKEKKKLPQNLTIAWDVSSSADKRNINKEIALLTEYLKALENAEVKVLTFSNTVHETKVFSLSNGNSSEILDFLKSQTFDGATNLGALNKKLTETDEILLFSDGLANFGTELHDFPDKNLFTINSSAIADHSKLDFIARKTKSVYLNLNRMSIGDGLEQLTYLTTKFVRTEGDVMNCYPSMPTALSNNFSVSGQTKNKVELNLEYRTTDDIKETETIKLGEATQTSSLVPLIWAQKKLQELNLNFEENKDEITALGKEFGLVTPNTSLIVLDRVEDYVEHEITPPEELMSEYNRMLTENRSIEESQHETLIADVKRNFLQRQEWWEKVYEVPKPKAYEFKKDKLDIDGYADSLVFNLYDASGSHDVEFSENEIELVDIEESENRAEAPAPAIFSSARDRVSEREMDALEQIEITANGATTLATGWAQTEGRNEKEGLKLIKKIEDEAKAKDMKSEISVWNPNTPYIKKLENVDQAKKYTSYLDLKKKYANQPSFYLDVADHFIGQDDKTTALRILSNIAELELENHELLRILGHRLDQIEEVDLAIGVFSEVLKIRDEEPQSHRDLALCYAKVNRDQEAIDKLYHIITNSWDSRFPDIQGIALNEMNNIIANSKMQLNLAGIDKDLIKNMDTDIRVIVNWDTDNCDMDLWVTDARNEKCMYNHKKTITGGRMSEDFTGGYGPEEFLIRRAIKGNYKVEINYYGSSSQKITGPTTVQVKLITNFGRPNQKIKEVTRRLEKSEGVIHIGDISI